MKKKILTSILALAVSAAPFTAFAENAAAPADAEITATFTASESAFISCALTVESIDENGEITGVTESGETMIIKTFESVVYNSKAEKLAVSDIKAGDKITAYVLGSKPATLQLPVTYSADAVIVEVEGGLFTDADAYAEDNGMFVNQAGTLALNISDDTKIVDANGEKAELGENLLVFYGASTRSIPAQTYPELVVVISGSIEEQTEPVFASRELTVDSVSGTELSCKDAEGAPYVIRTADAAIYSSKAEKLAVSDIKTGDKIKTYTTGNKPTTLQYPPTYSVDAIIVETEDGLFTDADAYAEADGMLVNQAGTLALNISEDTKIVDKNGEKTELGEKLVVFYGASTKSIPAQTNPELIVVISENTDAVAEAAAPDFSGVSSAIVNGSQIDFSAVNINGTDMMPLRSISEALGLTVNWNEDGSIQVGSAYAVTIGEDSYIKGKMTPVELGQAPVIINFGDASLCYVPAEFYTEILGNEVSTEDGTAVFNK